MLRKALSHSFKEDRFRNRGKEIFRIEALSDAVFAFSVSLLAASLEVPQTFEELKIIMTAAVPFFLTVALVFLFWYQQYIFFRRYGLNDFRTILLNLAYLAVIIFYVYPLKFLFSLLLSSWTGIDLFAKANEQGLVILPGEEFPQLIILFSIGYFLIWFLLYLMHRHVLQLSASFSFTRFERSFTQKEGRGALWNALVGLFAMAFAFLHWETLAGICYLFIPVLLMMNEYVFKGKVRKFCPGRGFDEPGFNQ